MVTTLHSNAPHTFKLEFADEPVTSFGGLVLAERMAGRLRLWTSLAGLLPARRGYDWLAIIKSTVMGLLSGAQGTYASEPLRHEAALLGLLSLGRAPEEVTLWRSLEALGEHQREPLRLPALQAVAARRVLEKMSRRDLLLEDMFVPVFADGTLLEGSARREGTKFMREKGRGLMWSTLFVGPVLAAQRLAGEGEGEQASVRAMLGPVCERVLAPLGLKRQALVLADSLHGDEPTLARLEAERLHYVVGANKLRAAEAALMEQPQSQWEPTGARPRLGWAASEACCCWVQCEGWPAKRLLVGRRWRREGEMIWNYAGVLTNLSQRELRPMMQARQVSFAQAVWRLYDAKAGMETLLSDGLSDLGLHHPPCQELVRNEGFYAAASLAWLLATAVDRIGGQSEPERGRRLRRDGQARRRPAPQRMRLWRLRRELFAVPARVNRHARQMVVRFLGLDEFNQTRIERYWDRIARC